MHQKGTSSDRGCNRFGTKCEHESPRTPRSLSPARVARARREEIRPERAAIALKIAVILTLVWPRAELLPKIKLQVARLSVTTHSGPAKGPAGISRARR
jgi:hypothetical protein